MQLFTNVRFLSAFNGYTPAAGVGITEEKAGGTPDIGG